MYGLLKKHIHKWLLINQHPQAIVHLPILYHNHDVHA